MRHLRKVVFQIVHPDQSEQVPADGSSATATTITGPEKTPPIHRLEGLGRRQPRLPDSPKCTSAFT